MSFADTQVLDDASGDAVTYVLIGEDKTGSRRLNSATTLSEPGAFEIKHTIAGNGDAIVDRHLASFTLTKLSAGKPRTVTVNFTVAVPRDSVVTPTMIQDLVANLVDFVTDGGFSDSGMLGVTNLTSLLRGES